MMNRNKEFLAAYAMIKRPKMPTMVSADSEAQKKIIDQLRTIGISALSYNIDLDEYKAYFDDAGYRKAYPSYYDFNIKEKSLEHYLAAKLLELNDKDVYIDIASELSPVPEIYARLYGAKCYRQDLSYEPGLCGDRIGGDAGNLPVPDGFATKLGLHCSLEHFEGDSDILFIREASRVLRPGGRVCIIPLYLCEFYAIQTDPVVATKENVDFDSEAVICCAEGWRNRHGRFYDYLHLRDRIIANLNGMKMRIIAFLNTKDVDMSCYVFFAMMLDKPSA